MKGNTRIQLGIVVLLALLMGSSFTPYRPGAGPIRTLVIDPGHGGKDPGALGARQREKHLNLGVALALRDLLQTHMPEIKVVMTRDRDKSVTLYRRAKIAQLHQADFFLSLHCNSSPNKESLGSESYVLGYNRGDESYRVYTAENKAILYEDNHEDVYGEFDPKSPEASIFFNLTRKAYRDESLRMAAKVQSRMRLGPEREDRGIKQAPFMVLWMSGISGVLVEMGFITNKKEEKYLASEKGQQELAQALFEAIREYNGEF